MYIVAKRDFILPLISLAFMNVYEAVKFANQNKLICALCILSVFVCARILFRVILFNKNVKIKHRYECEGK